MKRDLIGHVGVDSGLISVGDPCYMIGLLKDDNDWQTEVVDVLHPKEGMEPDLTLHPFNLNQTLLFRPPNGDGRYPVYVTRNTEGEIVSITIDLMP